MRDAMTRVNSDWDTPAHAPDTNGSSSEKPSEEDSSDKAP